MRDEQLVLFIRRHWLSFLPWIIFIGLMIIIPIIMFTSLRDVIVQSFSGPGKIYLIVGFSSYLLIAFAVYLTAWISFYLNVVIITPEHLVDIRQSGLFNRRVSEQSLLRVQDVSAHMSGLFQTFFNYGSVNVETAGEAPNFAMPSIPNPSKVANTILKLHEELVQKSGYEDADSAEGVGLEEKSSKNDERGQHIFEKDSQVTEGSPDQYRYQAKRGAGEMIRGLHREIAANTMTDGDSWFDGVKIEKKEKISPTIDTTTNEEIADLPSKTIDDKSMISVEECNKKEKPIEEIKIKKELENVSQNNIKKTSSGILPVDDNNIKEGELSEGITVQF